MSQAIRGIWDAKIMAVELRRYPNANAVARAAAEYFVDTANHFVDSQGYFSVALSGGSTPKVLYSLLATDFQARIPWSNVYLFWSDERCVPPDHVDSNYRMVKETLLDYVPIPESNSFRIHSELNPVQAAEDYEQKTRSFFKVRRPRFDLVLLGLGDDGHTASLFADTSALNETERWVSANYVEKFDAWRITLTLPVINASANVAFLVVGGAKADTLKAVIGGRSGNFPAQRVAPGDGTLIWFVDDAAAQFL
jgi:6-phosphogluconolactonase